MERLQPELDQIGDPRIKTFTEFALQQAPEYFWEVPSSSTGKYHPEWSNGEGGLVRHARAVVYLAVKLCDVYRIVGREKDCVISACIIHDILKYGKSKHAHTTKNHDYEGAVFVRELGEQFGLDVEALNAITGSIAWHMGRWTVMTGRTVPRPFPEGYTQAQLVVHLADVVAAQKNVSLSHIQ